MVGQPNTDGADDKHRNFAAEYLSSNANTATQGDSPLTDFVTVQEKIDMVRL